MVKVSWLAVLLAGAVLFGPLGVHDLSHSFDPCHHAEDFQVDGTDACYACSFASTPGHLPVVALEAPGPVIHEYPVPEFRAWLPPGPSCKPHGERAPPSL